MSKRNNSQYHRLSRWPALPLHTRKGGIIHTEILLPDNAPAEYSDRAILWNSVEKIEVTNQRLRQLKARIYKLQNWLKEEAENTEPPTFADVIQGILSRREQTGKSDRYQTIGNLKAAAKMLNFLQQNQIMDMAGLEEKVKDMYGKTTLPIKAWNDKRQGGGIDNLSPPPCLHVAPKDSTIYR